MENIIRYDNDVSVIIDSDMFLLKGWSFSEFLGDFHLAALRQRRRHVRYIWNGLVVMRPAAIPGLNEMNWHGGYVDAVPVDVGGNLFHWMNKYADRLRFKHIYDSGAIEARADNLFLLPEEVRPLYRDEFCIQILEGAVVHYRKGSNYNQMGNDYHVQKSRFFENLINGCVSGRFSLMDFDYQWMRPCGMEGE
ncbi:hypothetical protein [Arenibaculum pallidiluteum]|uniref:hypothetical protein n=1 Tax=Arenibaculum pallidiluteum TaxID=2812559 RepID=UPI001A963756|nr:hypothetical protein [Arenibaculum pallidiluteum]